MIKVSGGIASREPVPAFLVGLAVSDLADLTWTDPALGVQDSAWWPEEYADAPLGPNKKWGDEVLKPDPSRRVVVVTRKQVNMTAAEKAERDVQVLADWTQRIADRRYRAEIAGFLWNGFGIDTERDSQAKISSSWSAARDGFREDGSVWKCLDLTTGQIVSRPTTNAEMIDIGQQAYRYVQACYDREGALLEAAAGGTVTAEMIEEGWPT